MSKRVLVIYPIDPGGLADNVSLYFKSPENSSGIGGKIRIAGAGCEYYGAAFFQMVQSG